MATVQKESSRLMPHEVALDKIKVGKRFREDEGDLSGLMESMREKGLIQPITIDTEYNLLAGGRRTAAAKLLEWKSIPAIMRKSEDEADAREIELYENVFRQDFKWDERVKLIAEIDKLNKAKKQDWSARKTAELLGVGAASVSRNLQLARALEVMPELASEVKTEAEAFKVLKSLEVKHGVEELRGRQKERMVFEENKFLERASNAYHIGDTFAALATIHKGMGGGIVECDPPYAIDLEDVKKGADSTNVVKGYKEWTKEAYPETCRKLAKELYRVANTNSWLIWWFGPTWFTEVKEAIRSAGWELDDIPGIWNKTNGQTMQPSIHLGRAYEPFFIARKGNPAVVKQGRSNIFTFAPVQGTKKYHPTQRPTELIQEILRTFAVPTTTLLVPFLGSGASLRAGFLEGMSCFGWDLDGKYKDQYMLAVDEDMKKLEGSTEDEDEEE